MVKLKLNPPKEMNTGNETPVQAPAALGHSSPLILVWAQRLSLRALIDVLKYQLPLLQYPIRIRVFQRFGEERCVSVRPRNLPPLNELWEGHTDLRYLSPDEVVAEEKPKKCRCDETDPPENPIGLGTCGSKMESIVMFCQHEHVTALKNCQLNHHPCEGGSPAKRFRVCYQCRSRAHNCAPPVCWPSDNENGNDGDDNHGGSSPSNDKVEDNEPDLNPHEDARQENEQANDNPAHGRTAMRYAHQRKVTIERAYWRRHQRDWPQLLGHEQFNTEERRYQRTIDLQQSRIRRQVRETRIENLMLSQRIEVPALDTAAYARMMLKGLNNVFYADYDGLKDWEKRWIFDWEEHYRTQAGLPRIPTHVQATLNNFALRLPNAHTNQNDQSGTPSIERDTNPVRPRSSLTHAPRQLLSASSRPDTAQAQETLLNAAETSKEPEDRNRPLNLQKECSPAPAATRLRSSGQRMPMPNSGSEEAEDGNLQLALIRDAEQRRREASRFEPELPYSKDSNEFVLDPRWREEGRRCLRNQGLQQNVPTSILEYRAMAPPEALALQLDVLRLARTRGHVHQDTNDLSESDRTAAGVLRLINEALTTNEVALQLFGQQLDLRQWVWHVRLFYAIILHSQGWTVDVGYGSEENYDDLFQDSEEVHSEEGDIQEDSDDKDDGEVEDEPHDEDGSGDCQSGNDNKKSGGAQSLASGGGRKPPDRDSSSGPPDHRAKGSKKTPSSSGSSSGSSSQGTKKQVHGKSSKNEKSSSPSRGQPKPSSAEGQMKDDENRYNTTRPHIHSTVSDEDVSSPDRPRKRKSPHDAPDPLRKRSKGSPSSASSSSTSHSSAMPKKGKQSGEGSGIPEERGRPRTSGNVDESAGIPEETHRSRQEDIRSATEKIIQWVRGLREQHQESIQNADNRDRPPQQSHNGQQGVEAPQRQVNPCHDPIKAGPLHDSHHENDPNARHPESNQPTKHQPKFPRGERRAGNNHESPTWAPVSPPGERMAGNNNESPTWEPVSPPGERMAGAGGNPNPPDGNDNVPNSNGGNDGETAAGRASRRRKENQERREARQQGPERWKRKGRERLAELARIADVERRLIAEHQERLIEDDEEAPKRVLVRQTLREYHALEQRTRSYGRRFQPASRGASWIHWIKHAHTDVCGRCHFEQKRLHPQGFRGCTCYADRYQSQWLCNQCDEVACSKLMYEAAHVNDSWQCQQIVDGRFDANAPSSAPLGRCLCGIVGTLRNDGGMIYLSDDLSDPPDLPQVDTRYLVKRCGLCLNFVVPAGGSKFPDPRPLSPPPSHNKPVRKPRKPRVKGEGRRTRFSRRQQGPACNTAYKTPMIDLLDVPIYVNAEGNETDQGLVMLDAQGRPIEVNETGFEVRLGPREWQIRNAKAREERNERARRRRRRAEAEECEKRARDRELSRPYLMELDLYEPDLDARHSRIRGMWCR